MNKSSQVQFQCPACGTDFKLHRSDVARRADMPCCSKRCHSDYRASKTAERFWSRVNKDGPLPSHRPELGGCWIWTANKNPNGYGNFTRANAWITAHRFSWELHFGEALGCVLHKCDNPACVNPEHLFVGTHKINADDAKQKARHSHGEKHGMSKLTEAKVISILARFRNGESRKSIASSYGVGYGTIKGIIAGKAWAHLSTASNSRKALSQQEKREP